MSSVGSNHQSTAEQLESPATKTTDLGQSPAKTVEQTPQGKRASSNEGAGDFGKRESGSPMSSHRSYPSGRSMRSPRSTSSARGFERRSPSSRKTDEDRRSFKNMATPQKLFAQLQDMRKLRMQCKRIRQEIGPAEGQKRFRGLVESCRPLIGLYNKQDEPYLPYNFATLNAVKWMTQVEEALAQLGDETGSADQSQSSAQGIAGINEGKHGDAAGTPPGPVRIRSESSTHRNVHVSDRFPAGTTAFSPRSTQNVSRATGSFQTSVTCKTAMSATSSSTSGRAQQVTQPEENRRSDSPVVPARGAGVQRIPGVRTFSSFPTKVSKADQEAMGRRNRLTWTVSRTNTALDRFVDLNGSQYRSLRSTRRQLSEQRRALRRSNEGKGPKTSTYSRVSFLVHHAPTDATPDVFTKSAGDIMRSVRSPNQFFVNNSLLDKGVEGDNQSITSGGSFLRKEDKTMRRVVSNQSFSKRDSSHSEFSQKTCPDNLINKAYEAPADPLRGDYDTLMTAQSNVSTLSRSSPQASPSGSPESKSAMRPGEVSFEIPKEQSDQKESVPSTYDNGDELHATPPGEKQQQGASSAQPPRPASRRSDKSNSSSRSVPDEDGAFSVQRPQAVSSSVKSLRMSRSRSIKSSETKPTNRAMSPDETISSRPQKMDAGQQPSSSSKLPPSSESDHRSQRGANFQAHVKDHSADVSSGAPAEDRAPIFLNPEGERHVGIAKSVEMNELDEIDGSKDPDDQSSFCGWNIDTTLLEALTNVAACCNAADKPFEYEASVNTSGLSVVYEENKSPNVVEEEFIDLTNIPDHHDHAPSKPTTEGKRMPHVPHVVTAIGGVNVKTEPSSSSKQLPSSPTSAGVYLSKATSSSGSSPPKETATGSHVGQGFARAGAEVQLGSATVDTSPLIKSNMRIGKDGIYNSLEMIVPPASPGSGKGNSGGGELRENPGSPAKSQSSHTPKSPQADVNRLQDLLSRAKSHVDSVDSMLSREKAAQRSSRRMSVKED